jgi:peptide/nickel transport system permease protein
MKYGLFIVRRIVRGIFTIWFAITLTFLLLRLLPSDPASAVGGERLTVQAREILLSQFGLDQPLIVQYEKYLWQLLHGNLGISFAQGTSVTDALMSRLPWTLLLTGTALAVTLVIGVPLGVLAASRIGGVTDGLIQMIGVVGQSTFIPSIGIFLLYMFGLVFNWFPIGGAQTEGVYGWAWYLSVLQHLVLPATSLVILQLGPYLLMMRASMIDALGEDYCTLAHANGLPYKRILWKHALRNALLPTTTLTGLQLGALVGGAVLTETVFAYPGVGRAVFEAVTQLDYPMLQGAFVLLAAAVVAANMITDIVYEFLDPRVATV